MEVIVQKYGGSSVGTPEKIRKVAKKIAHTMKGTSARSGLCIVVSAMGKTTDELMSLASEVSPHPDPRESDMLLSVGERVTMALLSMALKDLGVSAVSLTGSQVGIITDEHHRRARIKCIYGDRLKEALAREQVSIVAGFQGMSPNKEITTLGRGGSDTTAVALAIALSARQCEIYTDVPGVMTADPKRVSQARTIPKLSLDQMVHLAAGGARVMSSRSVELARKYSMGLVIRSTFEGKGETQVIAEQPKSSLSEQREVLGVTFDPERVLVRIGLRRSTVQGSIWAACSENQFQIYAPFFSGEEVWFFVERARTADWGGVLEKLVSDGFVSDYKVLSEQSPLTIVGAGFSQEGVDLQKTIEILAYSEIFATMGTASSTALVLGIPTHRGEEALQLVHERMIHDPDKHS